MRVKFEIKKNSLEKKKKKNELKFNVFGGYLTNFTVNATTTATTTIVLFNYRKKRRKSDNILGYFS